MKGYENDKCHFCGADEAAYQRREDSGPANVYHDACEDCAKKPYAVKTEAV